MCNFELRFAAIDVEFAINFRDYFAWELDALAPLAEDGLISIRRRGALCYAPWKITDS